MYSLILLFPLLSFLFAMLGGFYFGREGVSLLVCLGQILSLLVVFLAFYEVVYCHCPVVLVFWHWLVLEGYRVTFGFLFDTLTCIMLLIVMVVSLCVHVYSVGYMAEDPYIVRFLAYLSLFTFFMLFLVCSDNFLQLFIGWEGVGLCSYLLINFWHKRLLANKAALKAMLLNRVADVVFLLAVVMIFLTFKTMDIVVVSSLVPLMLDDTMYFFGFTFKKIDLICFFLFIGAVGKSAQLGLHAWLPDAMEGPTPVSALLHAATMVTAGVFLIIRCSFFFEQSPVVLSLIALTGAFTSWFFSVTGGHQFDIKKVIAYSTCSQLGYMFFCCGLSCYNLALFHLFNHAFFKALLFLSAGSIIHALQGEQDLRRMGALVNILPFTYVCMLLGSITIMGFPFFSSFYSKDLILELTFGRFVLDGSFVYFLGVTAAFFTAFYSMRLLFLVFFTRTNAYRIVVGHVQENDFLMSVPLFLLAFLSVFVGFIFSEGFLGFGNFFFSEGSFAFAMLSVEGESMAPWLRSLPLCSTFLGLCVFFFFDAFFLERYFYWLYKGAGPFFYFALFFNSLLKSFFSFAHIFFYSRLSKDVEKGYFEYWGPFGFYKLFFFLGTYVRKQLFFSIFFLIAFLLVAWLGVSFFFFLHVHFLLLLARNLGFLFFLLSLLIFDFFFRD